MIGRTLGHYRIIAAIGAGGMGEVYRATDTTLGRDVAIKMLPAAVAQDPERLARFEREARSLAALNHPNIVTIYAVEEDGGSRFLAMELVEGETLDTLLAPGGLPLAQFFEIAVPLADALSAAHEGGIVHRDLKPGNVMVTNAGRVKVLDFGLAKVEAADSNPNLTSTPTESRAANLTTDGQVFGTVAYMSPEQARGGKVDARSDVFSLGIVMYQMVTGERPFHGETAADLISSILRDRPASVTQLRADLPPDLARVIRRCLEKDPRDRYQTSRDVYNELKELRAEASIAPPSAAPSRPVTVAPARHDSGSPKTQAFWIAVLPFTHSGGDPELVSFAEGLAEDVHAGLAKFPYLSVISRNSTLRFKTQTSDVRTVGQQLGARYVLEGGIRKGGSALRVHVQLVDAQTGSHLWAETYNRDLQGSDVLAVQDDVTDRVVATVADTSGALVRSMAASVEEKSDAELTAADVVLRHWRYQHRGTPAEHARVRDGLERFVEREPGHADVWACLARLYVHEFALGFNRRPEPLERALRAAQRAVDLDPTCQHARAGIAQVHFFRREVPAFRAAAEHAIALNPRDTDTLGVMGNMFTDSGDFERGPRLVRRAMELNPHFPDWFRFALTVEQFQKADYAGALDELARVNMPGFFWKELWVAACSGLAGRHAEAAAAVEELRRTAPDIERHAREFADSWLYASGLTDRFVEGLRKAGLEIPAEGEPVTPTRERPPSSPPISGADRSREASLDVRRTSGEEALATAAPGASAGATRPRNRRGWIAAAVAALLLAAILWFARSRAAAPRPPETPAEPQAIRSLAVLPLDNYSGDPAQDYFAEGMTDELTSDLANIGQLRVISRGSVMQFKGARRPPTPEIAKILNVDAIVEGSVLRSGDKVRITAQLIDARSDRHLWSKSFERNSRDVLALQDELASAIASEIHVRLNPEEQSRLTRAASVNPEAYDAYLKGRYFFNRPSDENLTKAIALFEEAIKLDPKFAPAYSGLSDVNLWAGFNEGVLANADAGPRAKAAAEEAIRLDDASAEAHTSLATYRGWYAHDWAGSEAEYRRAFALNPNYSFAHDQFSILLALQGRLDEAVTEGKRAAELDPLSPQIPVDALAAVAWQGKFQEAKDMARRAASLDPTYFYPLFEEGWMEIQAGRIQDAIPLLQKAAALGPPPFVAAWLGYAYGMTGDRTRAMAAIENLKRTSSLKGYVPPFNLAIVYLGLGDRARALDYLEQAYENNSQWMPYIRGDRIFDPLRSDPRFAALIRKMGFAR